MKRRSFLKMLAGAPLVLIPGQKKKEADEVAQKAEDLRFADGEMMEASKLNRLMQLIARSARLAGKDK